MMLDDINDLVEEIQQILSSETQVPEEELMDLAARLEEAVSGVSKRLRQVELLLSQGLRSEAIDLAEREPNLNELITALDFPEFEAWNERLEQSEISPVRSLPSDLAAELNDAYSAVSSVEGLLNRFRVQSLSRAPMAERIKTLRLLGAKDPDNPVWEKDLLEFERTRLEELKSQLEQAVRATDLEQLAMLDRELASTDWRVKVPSSLQKQAADAHRSLRRTSSRKEMETISYQLSDAFADFDLQTARQLRQRFDALCQIVNLPPNDGIIDVAGPALEWIDHENEKERIAAEHAQAVQDLESALEHNAKLDELQRLYHQATRREHILPQQLEARLADRMETLQTQASRKQTAIIAASMLAGITLVVAVSLFVRQIGIRSEIDGHVTQLNQLLQEAQKSGVLEPVTGYLARVDEGRPVVAGAPEIQGLRQQLESLQIAEAGRLSQISELIHTADGLSKSATTVEQLSEADEALRKANSLTKNASEKSNIISSQSRIKEKQRCKNQIDQAYGDSLAELTDQAANLPPDRLDGYTEILAQVSELISRKGVSPPLKISAEALQVKLDQQRSMISRNLEIARDLTAVTESVGGLTKYETELRDMVKSQAELSERKVLIRC
ncbi:MAG: hypothetical protein R3C20_05925 [Planctomycetaceae bacterium]